MPYQMSLSSLEVFLFFSLACFRSLLILIVQNLCFQNSIETSDADESQTMVGFPFLNKRIHFCLCHGYYEPRFFFGFTCTWEFKLPSTRDARVALKVKLKV